MALVAITHGILDDPDLFDMFFDTFETEFIRKEEKYSVFRITGDLVPGNDVWIELICYQFEGVRPFVLYANEIAHV